MLGDLVVQRRFMWATVSGVTAASLGAAIQGYTQGGWFPAAGGLVGGAVGVAAGLGVDRLMQASAGEQEALENWQRMVDPLPLELEPLNTDSTVAELLSADHEAVQPLWGRQPDLRQLTRWLSQPGSVGLAFLTGGPMTGKTRLSVELASHLRHDWHVGRLRDDGSGVVSVANALDKSALIVVEAHGWRPELTQVLNDLAKSSGQSPKIRILVLTRHVSWVKYLEGKLSDDAAGLVQRAEVIPLPNRGSARDMMDLFNNGAARYAEIRGHKEPSKVRTGLPSGTPIGIALAHALVHALSSSAEQPVGNAALAVELARHEQARWPMPSHAAIGQDLQMQIVAALLLVGARDGEDVRRTLRRVPDLQAASDERLSELAAWAVQIYPDASWASPALPDLITHGLVIPVFALDERFQATLNDGLDPLQLTRVGAFLLGAAQTFPEASDYAVTLFKNAGRDVDVDFLLASTVSTTASGLVDQVLAELLEDGELAAAALPLKDLVDDPDRYPKSYSGLRKFVVGLARAGLNNTQAQSCELAEALVDYGRALDRVGQLGDALDAHREAVALWRRLVAQNSATHTSGLAVALIYLGSVERDHGQLVDALATHGEAVKLWRGLVAEHGTSHNSGLAEALVDLGASERFNGQLVDALATHREAVRLWRVLVDENSAEHTGDLAHALTSLGVTERVNGQLSSALATHREAVELWRGLVAQNRAEYRPDFALALMRLGNAEGEIHPRDGLAKHREAVRLLRMLVSENSVAHTPALAAAVTNLAGAERESGQPAVALTTLREAVRLWRGLARENMVANAPDLVSVLTNLGVLQGENGHGSDSLATHREAVEMARLLVTDNSAAHTPNLALALTGLGTAERGTGLSSDAVITHQEAVKLWRMLAAENIEAHAADLARALINLGNAQSDIGRRSDARATHREALKLCEELAGATPEIYGLWVATVRRLLEVD